MPQGNFRFADILAPRSISGQWTAVVRGKSTNALIVILGRIAVYKGHETIIRTPESELP